MNYDPNSEISVAVLSGTIIFMLFTGFIIAYLVIYRRRQQRHKREVERMRVIFNEEILKAQLEIQEQTLTNISREIHDNVGQTLSVAKIQVSIINEKKQLDEELILSIKENISQAISDLRSMTRSMNTQRIMSLSLEEQITNEIERLLKTGLFRVNFSIEGNVQSLAEQNKLVLFRIFQESLQNIIRHAEASAVDIIVFYMDKEVKLEIRDDGKGFEIGKLNGKNEGLGLQSIRTRAELIGGIAQIQSVPGKGTKIQVTIPY